jgi:RND superfamily putative drug exporter
MAGLARWCFRHRKLVSGGWLLALIVLTVISRAAGISYATQFTLPDSPSTQAQAILQHDFPSAAGDADQIVLQARNGTVTSAPVRAAAETMLARVARLPRVVSVASPYGPDGASQVSRNGTIAFATVTFDTQAQDLPANAVSTVIRTAQAAQGPRLKVELSGAAIENTRPQPSSNSTVLGVVLALIVLGLAFGALFAALTPIVTALVAIGIGYALTGLLSHVIAIVSFAPILGVLIGLGVGIDYALFIVTRHRSAVRAGTGIETAAVNAIDTAGQAVFFAGLTVAIALLGQFALGMAFLDGAAVAATVTVVLTMLASITLLPALLGFIGARVLSRRQRRRLRVSGPHRRQPGGGHPWSGPDRPGDHRRGHHHDPGLPVLPAQPEHHHPAVRDRPGRGDHHRRLRGAYRAGAGPHAPVWPGQLVAARLAGSRAVHPAHRRRRRRPDYQAVV